MLHAAATSDVGRGTPHPYRRTPANAESCIRQRLHPQLAASSAPLLLAVQAIADGVFVGAVPGRPIGAMLVRACILVLTVDETQNIGDCMPSPWAPQVPFREHYAANYLSCARWGFQPSSRSAHRRRSAGPQLGCRVAHEQDPTGQGALLIPGTVVRSRPATTSDRHLPLCCGQSLYRAGTSHRRG